MPVDGTLAAVALTLMLEGRKISHPTFEAYTGSWRLAAHIYTLKRLGWPVQTEIEDFDDEDTNLNHRHMGWYYLPDEILDLVYNRQAVD